MDVPELLTMLGGVASRAQIIGACGRAAFDRSVAGEQIVKVGYGRYALPRVDDALAIAHAVGGVLCLASAALRHGWAVKLPPERPQVCLGPKRRLRADQQHMLERHWFELHADDIQDGVVTSKEATLTHCLRMLPFDEALAIADSAARAGETALLNRVARIARGRGAARVRRVVRAARREAANPFESVLRAIAADVEGLAFEPQLLLELRSSWVRPDLVDVEHRLVLEADSFEWHGGRAQLARDARRYNLMVIDRWLVLRFAWEDVMFDAPYVRETLEAMQYLVTERVKVRCAVCRAA